MALDYDSLAHFPERKASDGAADPQEVDALRRRVRHLERVLASGADTLPFDLGRAAGRPEVEPQTRLDNVFFRQLFENSPDGIVLLDARDRVIDTNRGFEELFGYSRSEVQGQAINELIVPEESAEEASDLSNTVLHGEVVTSERLRRRKDGSTVFVRLLGYPIFDGERLMGLFGIYSDVSFRVSAERRLRLQSAAMNSAANAILIADADGRIEWVNPAFSRLSGYQDEEVIGQRVGFLASTDESCQADQVRMKALAEGDLWRGQVMHRHKSGHVYTVDQTITRLCDPADRGQHFVVVQEDITARLEAEQRLKHLAGHDFLTDLPNRYNFTKQLKIEVERSIRTGQPVAAMLVDIDQFKDVNDTFGHSVGDELLIAVARRLNETLRDRCTLARFGGDEFAILQTDIDDIGNASGLARRLIDAFSEPVDVGDRKIHVGVSIGIAIFPPGEPNARELIRSADLALYQAKSEGRSTFRFYVDGMDRQVRQRMKYGQQLHGAVERGELFLEYQPQVDVETHEIVAFEGLLRWQHAERGLVGPSEFVPIAEASGLIVPIGEWVLRQACSDAQAWRRRYGLDIPVAVNLSAVQFKDPSLCESVLEALARSGLPPRLLELELTEGLLMQASDSVQGTLQRLRESGVRFSLDDFGKGYSSLGYLGRFSLDKLKIDRSFIRQMNGQNQSRVIVSTIALLGRKLGLDVVAEGVENEQQVQMLLEENCPRVQGFLYSAPLPVDRVSELLESGRGRLPARGADGGTPASRDATA